jgi:hypothetical protein
MARQTGVVTLKGTIGGIYFYKSRDGHRAREKGGVDGNRIKNDAAFQRTRENGAEVGRAGRASKILRDAIRVILQNAKDRRVVSRLTTEMELVMVSCKLNRIFVDHPPLRKLLYEGFENSVWNPTSFSFHVNYSILNTLLWSIKTRLKFPKLMKLSIPGLNNHLSLKLQTPVKLTTLRRFKLTSGGRCKLTTSGRSKLTTG